MHLEGSVTVVSGILATVGLGGIMSAAALKGPLARQLSLRIGSVAMTAAGLLQIVASLSGYGAPDAAFGGFMMMLFGTGVSLPIIRTPQDRVTEEQTR